MRVANSSHRTHSLHLLTLAAMLPATILFSLAVTATAAAVAAKKPFITTHEDITTECKTCPRSLCPNVELVRAPDTEEFNVTCWTRGTKIMGDGLWLKTDSDCYVTQYDLKEYEGNWDEDLAYCGRQSEEQHLTLEDATLRYKTECTICLSRTCDIISYLPGDTDLTLTCWTDQGTPVMDDPYYYKTTNNCYVASAGLYSSPAPASLDYCGPVPFLEQADHNNENGTSEVNKKRDPDPAEQAARYLVDVKVGEEYAYCRESPDEGAKVQERYEFNQTVWMQCVTQRNATWWAQSVDFCYCKGADFWEDPVDNYRMPLCEYFETPSGDDG